LRACQNSWLSVYAPKTIKNDIVDFYCSKLRLIEIDVSSHNSEEAHQQDLERQIELESIGLGLLRFDA